VSSPISFKGSPAVELLKRAQPVQRGLGHFILAKEGANGRSHMTCLQDTLVALLPRAMISRTQAEGVEVGFLEVLESLLIYYSVPMLGGPVFKHIMGRIGCKNFDVKDLTRPLAELGHLPEGQMKHLLPAKGALILSALTLTGIGGEYLINYTKNLMTAHYFNMDQFSQIANLSGGQMQSSPQESQVVKKSWKRVYQTLGACAGLLGSALALARFGHKLPDWVLKGPIRDGVKTFDFNFKNGAFGLTKNQMAAYMALSVPAYLDSARDSLEKWESASRLVLVLPYLLAGQDWLEKLIREKFPAITGNAGNGRLYVKNLDVLAKEKIQEVAGRMNVHLPENMAYWSSAQYKEVLDKAAKEFQAPLGSKIAHVLIPLAIGVFGTGFGVGLVNQYWTKRRFEQQLRQNKQQLAENRSQAAGEPFKPVGSPFQNAMATGLPAADLMKGQSPVVNPSPFFRPVFHSMGYPPHLPASNPAVNQQKVYVS